LIELKDEKEKNKFEIIVSKTKNGYAMKCNQGCAWKELTFSLAKDEVRYVDASGVSSTEFTTQLDDLPEFQFKVEEENNLIKLTKLSGSIWEDLGFSIQVNETYKLTNYGVNKI
jgi:plasmid maintenance system killer protein